MTATAARSLTAAPPATRRRVDGVTALTFFTIALYAIPTSQRLSALGQVGEQGTLLGLAALIWWLWYRAQHRRWLPEPGPNWVRIALFLFVVTVSISYISAMLRPIPSDETSPADAGLLRMLAFTGTALLALDGPPTMKRLLTVSTRIAVVASLVALLGLVQFVTGQSLIDHISIPGFKPSSDFAVLVARGDLIRPSGTSVHPLEFAAILTTALPLAITSALHLRGLRAVGMWACSAALVVTVFLSGSRSAFIAIAASIVPLVLALGIRARLIVIGAVVVLGIGVYVLFPTAITNVLYLFTAIQSDSSAASRTGSFGIAGFLFGQFPVFGRGLGTMLPEYHIFDDQYLAAAVELGAVGLAILVLLLLGAIGSIVGARRRFRDQRTRDFGVALIGSVLANAALLALFDEWSFPQAAGTMFLAIGLCGAYWRLSAVAERA